MDRDRLVAALDDALARWSRVQARGYGALFRECPTAAAFQHLVFDKLFRSRLAFRVGAHPFFGGRMTTRVTDQELHLAGLLAHPSEVRLARYLVRHLSSDDVFFDIGAHHGYFALLARRLLADGSQIRAFEPAPAHFSLLAGNVGGEGIRAENLALFSRAGRLRFFENLKGASTIDRRFFDKNPAAARERFRETEVEAATLDGYCQAQGLWPTVLKLDVEGAEPDVLEGGSQALARSPRLLLEIWRPPMDNSPHLKAIASLTGLGYRPFLLNASGDPEPLATLDPLRDIAPADGSDNFLFQKS